MNKIFLIPLLFFISACTAQKSNHGHLKIVEPHTPCKKVGAMARSADGTIMLCSHDDEVSK